MDQLSAHLDRGWDLVHKGDSSGALACARRALELDPKSPEVHNLLGYASAMGGDAEEALEHYRDALALDENYFEAMLNAAEVLVSARGDWEEAIALCEEAETLAESDEELADCLLLKVDALLGKGASEEAARVLGRLPTGPFENPNYDYLIGRAYYEIGQPERAVPHIEGAVKRAPMHADARYYMGLLCDERGDRAAATDAFLHARALDAREPAAGWAPSPETFGSIVKEVMTKLDAALAPYIREAEVYCFDHVGPELVVDGVDPRALVILDLAPPADGDGRKGRVFVYQRNVERAAGSVEGLEGEIARALEHEIAAVFAEAKRPDASSLN